MIKDENNHNATGLKTMASSIEFADNYSKWTLDIFREHIRGKVLEVGTGFGNYGRFLTGIESLTAIDCDEEVIKRAAEADKKNKYIVADIESDGFCEIFGEARFDTILCFNVLEHVKDDRKAAANLFSLLASRGQILLLLPGLMFLYNDLDRLAGHHRRYTTRTAAALFEGLDCRILKNEYFNPAGGAGWLLNKMVKHNNIDSGNVNFQVLFFDKYILPLSRLANGLTRKVFGQSVIIAGEKL